MSKQPSKPADKQVLPETQEVMAEAPATRTRREFLESVAALQLLQSQQARSTTAGLRTQSSVSSTRASRGAHAAFKASEPRSRRKIEAAQAAAAVSHDDTTRVQDLDVALR
jgi:hypothetical protein